MKSATHSAFNLVFSKSLFSLNFQNYILLVHLLEDLKNRVGDTASIIKIDVDKNPAVAQNYHIQGVPTLILFQKGQLKWRQSGVVQKKQLEHVVNQLA